MIYRSIKQLYIHPINGSIVALADDGTLWVRDGSIANHAKPWKQIVEVPPINPPQEEPESAITTIVK